jgi:hypothetical protein
MKYELLHISSVRILLSEKLYTESIALGKGPIGHEDTPTNKVRRRG